MAKIEADNLTIEFPIYGNSNRSLKKSIINLSTGGRIAESARRMTIIRAVDNISFMLKDGCRLGILGHNGSGKSTLLRSLAGVYAPTLGRVAVSGSVASLLDISLGMDDEASGYENILLRGIYLGHAPREMTHKIDEISEASGLGDYLNLPIRTYSSGMRMRLGFAISTSVHADILLMDEWLSVGDAEFQEKASAKLQSVIDRAGILVLASHQPELIRQVCNRVITLQQGRIVSDELLGGPHDQYGSIAGGTRLFSERQTVSSLRD